MATSILIVLFSLLLTVQVHAQCGIQVFGQERYYLDSLTKPDPYRIRTGDLTYIFNFCKSIPGYDSDVYAVQTSPNGNIVIGRAPATYSKFDNATYQGVIVGYTATPNCANNKPRRTYISVVCSPKATTPIAISASEVELCMYNITVESAAACPFVQNETCGVLTGKNGTLYNLAPLSNFGDYNNTYSYDVFDYWNFCRNLSISGCADSTSCSNYSGRLDVKGRLPAFISEGSRNFGVEGITVMYNETADGDQQKTKISVACDQKAIFPVFVSYFSDLYDSSLTIIEMKSAFACGKSSTRNLCCGYDQAGTKSPLVLCTTDATCPNLPANKFIGWWGCSCNLEEDKKIVFQN